MSTAFEDDTFEAAWQRHRAGDFSGAEALYEQAAAAQPLVAEIWHRWGLAAHQSGRSAVGIERLERAIALDATREPYYVNLGAMLRAMGRMPEAGQAYERALALNPDSAIAHNNYSNVLKSLGKPQEAIDHLQQAVRLLPTYTEAWMNLGALFFETDRFEEAEPALRQALVLNPKFFDGEKQLAEVLSHQSKAVEAVPLLRNILAREPENVMAAKLLSIALFQLKEYVALESLCREFLVRHPNDAVLLNQLGLSLSKRDNRVDALELFRQAHEMLPTDGTYAGNVGTMCHDLFRLDEALHWYTVALEASPELVNVRWNRSLVMLAKQQFEEGWKEYEHRWKATDPPPPYHREYWDGSPLGGRRILLQGEQGLGDILQFVRYAAWVRERGGHVMVGCRAPAVKLLARCPFVDEVVTDGNVIRFDQYIPLLSLPRVFQTGADNMPREVPYLFADEARAASWSQRWSEREQIAADVLKVGIVWQGNPSHSLDCYRSIPLTQFTDLAKLANVRLISLQTVNGLDQLANWPAELPAPIDVSSELNDLDDVAAVIASLDLVVTCDTAIAHLAGGLGKPVWLALAATTDWRWTLAEETTPWYPTARLYRQRELGNWGPVFDRIAHDVGKLAAERASS